jgi:hypothetical protein
MNIRKPMYLKGKSKQPKPKTTFEIFLPDCVPKETKATSGMKTE